MVGEIGFIKTQNCFEAEAPSDAEYEREQPDPLADAAADIVRHMNADLKESLILLARTFARIESQEATMTR